VKQSNYWLLPSGKALLILTVIVSLGGCSALLTNYSPQKRQGTASSLVDYLYPNGEIPPGLASRIPHIKVPIRLGIAFVPGHSNGGYILTESHKQLLLEKVKRSFANRPIIQSIKIIPSHYIARRGGFANLSQLGGLYGVDQIALVSYDQAGTIHANPLSITYWTIVGAYIIPGNSHNIQTFVDTAVFDVKSKKLLMRAAGQNKVRRVSTMVHRRALYRKASQTGFVGATERMIANLDSELYRFKSRLRQGSKEVVVEYRPGFSGSADALLILISIMGLVIALRAKNA